MWIDKRNAEGYSDPTTYEVMRRLMREDLLRRYGTEYRPLVFICSPFAGDMEKNTERTRGYCRFAVEQNAIPLAPHLLYPQFMDDGNKAQRNLGIRSALILLGKCDELWAFGGRVSEGMSREIAKAKRRGMPVRYFNDKCEEVSAYGE